jgi:hypothetical protein
VANIEGGNPAVEINVVDPIRRKGYRFKGTATVHRQGAVYESGLDFYHQRSGLDSSRVAAIVLVRVEWAAPIISPARRRLERRRGRAALTAPLRAPACRGVEVDRKVVVQARPVDRTLSATPRPGDSRQAASGPRDR